MNYSVMESDFWLLMINGLIKQSFKPKNPALIITPDPALRFKV